MIDPISIKYFDSGDLCEYIEDGCKFKNDLWYYWTATWYEINEGTIAAIDLTVIIDKLLEFNEVEMAKKLKDFANEVDPDNMGIFVGYFW